MLKAVIVKNAFKKRQRSSDEEAEIKPNFQPHYVTFFLHDDMDFEATHYMIQQRGPFLFSSESKAKLFTIKSLVRMLVSHYMFDTVHDHVKQARDAVRQACIQQSFHLGLMKDCIMLVEHFYAKQNGDCGVQWQVDVVPQVDVYNEIDLL